MGIYTTVFCMIHFNTHQLLLSIKIISLHVHTHVVLTIVVPCPLLTDPNNGMITCSLGDDGVPSYEDTCSFTCNTGYELTGNDIRTCQSDRSWSGSDDVCRRGMIGEKHTQDSTCCRA